MVIDINDYVCGYVKLPKAKTCLPFQINIYILFRIQSANVVIDINYYI